MITRSEAIGYAKAAMLNNREIYDEIDACMDYREHAGNDLAWFGSMLADMLTLHEDDINAAFPWAHFDTEAIAVALAEIVEEWKD